MNFALPVVMLQVALVPAVAPGVENAQRARMNWALQCQGCHKQDATGMPERGTPSLVGFVARFLSVEGGRAYLTRVPGVANAGLADNQLAELLNWTLYTFDKDHVPAGFAPLTADETKAGRSRPFISEAAAVRTSLIASFPAASTKPVVGRN